MLASSGIFEHKFHLCAPPCCGATQSTRRWKSVPLNVANDTSWLGNFPQLLSRVQHQVENDQWEIAIAQNRSAALIASIGLVHRVQEDGADGVT
jgi:hypothetical protein